MKTWMLILLLVAALCTLAEGQTDPNGQPATKGITAWLLGDHNAFVPRLGYLLKQYELGSEVEWSFGVDGENDPVRYGPYALYHLPEALNIENLPLFNMLNGQIQGVTYLGAHGGVETVWGGDTQDRYFFGPVAGAAINKFVFDSVKDEVSVVTEAQYNKFTNDSPNDNRDEFRLLLGIRILTP